MGRVNLYFLTIASVLCRNSDYTCMVRWTQSNKVFSNLFKMCPKELH